MVVEKEKDLKDSNCYLTMACMKHLKEDFDNDCYELTIMRWFRDNFISEEDINHYYEIAPTIVEMINNQKNSEKIYDEIYETVISKCIFAIKKRDYAFAYNNCKNSVLNLEKKYIKPEKPLTRVLTQVNK